MSKLAELLGPLECPIVFLDTETTGLHAEHDRVVQIGIVKVYPDGAESEWSTLVNPGIPIPPEVTAVHHISDDHVKSAPTFEALAPKLAKGFEKCDFGGHNVEFDLKFLRAEFRRLGMKDHYLNGRVLDSQRVFHDGHKRRLIDAAKVYLGVEFETEAHDALSDARMSLRVFEAQLEKHSHLPRDVGQLHRLYFEEGVLSRFLDWRHGEMCVQFGNKYVNVSLREIAKRDPGYLHWILRSDFPRPVNYIVQEALEGRFPVKA